MVKNLALEIIKDKEVNRTKKICSDKVNWLLEKEFKWYDLVYARSLLAVYLRKEDIMIEESQVSWLEEKHPRILGTELRITK